MMLLKIALRNILRNGRRSLMTGAAIAVGAIALILFCEYRGMAMVGLETGYVRDLGHLSVFRRGYSDFGSGNPAAYGISDYRLIVQLIEDDPVLKPLLNVVTPTVNLGGIAGNAALDRSMTFFGAGFEPSARDRMRRWDEYRLYAGDRVSPFPLADGVVDRGVVGRGLARILGLCPPKGDAVCPPPGNAPRIELFSGANGAPNVVEFYVNKTQSQGARELDDHYIGMHLDLAQRLLYGGGERKAISIVIQLKRTEDMAFARDRLEALIAERRLALEVRDFRELATSFDSIVSALSGLFAFVSIVLGMVVLFTIANTMGMSVMERTSEVGTARAIGVRRCGIRRQFLLEGTILGAGGASAGVVLALALTWAINRAHITYMMPISASPVPLYLMTDHIGGILSGVWLGLVAIAAAASLVPANHAARMNVADALKHV
jgi:putative ABC transport system permease protein